MSSSTNISIKSLAAYCLDYARLISGNMDLHRGPKANLGQEFINASCLFYEDKNNDGGDKSSFVFELITNVDHDINMPEDQKTEEQIEAEKRLVRDKETLGILTDISNKLKTQEYTKKLILETGIVRFTAKRADNGFFIRVKNNGSDAPENTETALVQIPVSMDIYPQKDAVTVKINLAEPYLKFAIEPINIFLKQAYYDDIFELVTKIDAEDRNTIPAESKIIEEVWAKIKTYLALMNATNISETPDFSYCTLRLATKTNYFLAEDLNILAEKEDGEMEKTSLGAWSSDEKMDIEYDVLDDGQTEIFFPFQYDKYQLKVLGIINNRASIVEGPPGTGKSQTIANILCHLAATGKKVLFVSQKDQAVRGVKDRLKTLGIPFLFGYIPDRTSRLYTEEDEHDSAVNTLKNLQKTQKKMAINDQKLPLRLIYEKEKDYSEGVDSERRLFTYYEQRRELDYVKIYSELGISRKWWSDYNQIWTEASQLAYTIKDYTCANSTLIKKEKSELENIEINYVEVNEFLARILVSFKKIIPERSNAIKGVLVRSKMNSSLKKQGRLIVQEVYRQVEKIIFSEATKTARLRELQSFKGYIENCMNRERLALLKTKMLNTLAEKKISQEQAENLRSIIAKMGEEVVFDDIDNYSRLSGEINRIDHFHKNALNHEIKELQKYHRGNVCNYIRNRILESIEIVNSQKKMKAIFNRVANSLAKSKKAYKTFDRLKNGEEGPENFKVMSEAIPIWMMGLEDVNRIIPMVANTFDYVILDEASQCNLAYSLPVMYRAKHAVFFGDSLQMRDTNTLFKSNQQLDAIAKKNKVSEYYQIKASEDAIKSVMDIATLAGFKTTVLRYHYRSPAELIGFSNTNFYETAGRSLEVVNDNILTYKDTNRVLINHVIQAPNENEDSGKRNHAEVEYIKHLVKDLKNDPKTRDKTIAVLTFFNEQAELLRQSIEEDDVKISIIEGIQGDERDIVIYSFVIRDSAEKKRYIALTGEGGSVRKGAAEGRVNVAFSRAKFQVHCVTSLAPELWPEGIWIKKYLEYVDKNGIPQSRNKAEGQIFDSRFEEEVYTSIAKELDNRSYLMETQVKSCGFRIDLVIKNKRTGRKLAIECDGPTHFENGDGQVYVKNDWERQMVLEVAGWHFYRISYFDWVEKKEKTLSDILTYIYDYFNDSEKSIYSIPDSVNKLKRNEKLPKETIREKYVTSFSDNNF